MKQYSDLDVYGKIKQKKPQGTENDDVVLYPTLTTRVPADIPAPTPGNVGKAIVVNSNGNGFTLGEAGKVDDVKINTTSIVSNKIATIPYATASVYGVVQVDSAMSASSTNPVQNSVVKSYIDTAITNLPEPMIFKGSVGTDGTITDLPTASASNEGWTYKVITAGTYASISAKVGDTFICAKTSDNPATFGWVLIPSGDEPSGTVISVTAGVGLAGGTITESGTIKANLNSESSIGTIGTNKVYAVGVDSNGKLAVNVPWEANTHYTANLIANTANNSTSNATTAITNGNLYLNLVENSTVRNYHKIVGAGATTVTRGASDNTITITSTDSHYTATPVLGGSSATSNATTATANNATYLGIVENSAHSGHVQITGSGGTSVSAVSGVLTITSPSLGTGASNAAYGNHTHTTSLATDSGTATVTLAHNTTYKLTAGGTSVIFKTPTDNNTDTLVKQTATSNTTSYPILASKESSPTSGNNYESRYSTTCYLNNNELYSGSNYCWTSGHSPFATTDVSITES